MDAALSERGRQSSWIADALAGAVFASGVGYVLTSYSVSRWLTRPSRGKSAITPASLNLPFDNVACRTLDGHRLAGWVVTPPKPRGTVALFHGLRQNRSQTLPRIALLFEAGYRCVAFDHRAHGQSSGRQSSFGYHEAKDVQAVLRFMVDRWPDGFRAGLGISMGAAAVCFAGRLAHAFDACILESLYHDLASAFHNRIGTKFPLWFQRFEPGVVWVTEKRLKLKLGQVSPADHMANLCQVPVLLITGRQDIHAPPADTERLRQRCTGPVELTLIDGADHVNLCTGGGEAYRLAVLDFLERSSRARRSPHSVQSA
jgi:pimeloyl-ACP methyl ester carboxylesterase